MEEDKLKAVLTIISGRYITLSNKELKKLLYKITSNKEKVNLTNENLQCKAEEYLFNLLIKVINNEKS